MKRLGIGLLLAAGPVWVLGWVFAPLLEPGLAAGNDTRVHVGAVVQTARLVSESPPPWDWLPDVAGGHGGPNFIYYGSLSYVVPAALVKAGLSPVAALRVLIGLAFAIGAASSYLWCRAHGGQLGGLAGMALFLSGPYVWGLAYARGSYPELFAYALYPFVFLLSERWVETRRATWLALAAAVFFAIVGAHTLSLILVLPVLVVYCLAIAPGRPVGRLRSTAVVCLALVLVSSTFLVGPLFERHKVGIAEQFASASLYESIGVPWYAFFNKSTLNDIVSRAIPGRVHLLALGTAAVVALSAEAGSHERRVGVHVAVAILALLLLEQTIAALTLKVAPPLKYLQFPWRWLGVFNLFTAVALAGVLRPNGLLSPRLRVVVAAAVPLFACVFYQGLVPAQVASRFDTATLAGLRSNKITLDHENKYLPAGAKPLDVEAPAQLLQPADPECVVAIKENGLNDHTFEVIATVPTDAVFHQYRFDGWRCRIDGEEAPLGRAEESGLCTVALPEGHHVVGFEFTPIPLRRVGWWTTCLSAAVLVWLCTIDLRRGRDRPNEIESTESASEQLDREAPSSSAKTLLPKDSRPKARTGV